MTKYTPRLTNDQVRANFESLIADATMQEISQAATWYNDANIIARELSLTTGHSLEVCASLLSAFSPKTKWAYNVFLATQYANGEKVAALPVSMVMAKNSITMGFNAFNGHKTKNFARNIAGDLSFVTVDVWMIRASGLVDMDFSGKVNKAQYTIISDIVTDMANHYGVFPAQMQALIWIKIRGEAY